MAQTAVVHFKGTLGSYRLEPTCHCVAGQYHCESDTTLASLRTGIEAVTGAKLQGFGGSSYGERFTLPGNPLNAAALEQDRATRAAAARSRNLCERKAAPDFENMMKQ